MPDSTYKIIEIVGTSTESWEQATRNAIQKATETLHDMRIAEVVQQDVTLENGKIQRFRTRLSISFKYQK
ncbi:MAG: dodecin family protein [Desulfohalobiaceae bacterium]